MKTFNQFISDALESDYVVNEGLRTTVRNLIFGDPKKELAKRQTERKTRYFPVTSADDKKRHSKEDDPRYSE